MATVQELIRVEQDGTLSFGNYELAEKTKKDGFEYDGDSYKIKTFSEITKLEKNGMFVYESVPGTVVENYRATGDTVSFKVSCPTDVQFTLELEEDCEYVVYVNEEKVGDMKTNLSGKLSVSVELSIGSSADIRIEKA